MASYDLNPDGVAKAEQMIAAGQYVVSSRWGDVQPDADKPVELAAHELLQRLDARRPS
jgi:hypothetical protein